MSWLFDRLCEIASTDGVEIVVHADLDAPGSADALDVADVLLRASRIPQTTVDVYTPSAATSTFRQPESVFDLGDLPPVDRADAIRLHLHDVMEGRAAHLRICGDEVSVNGDVDPSSIGGRWTSLRCDEWRWRRVVVTDRPGLDSVLAGAVGRGLGISVGGVDPAANMHVPDLMGAASVLDALVTLRCFAFGLGSELAPAE